MPSNWGALFLWMSAQPNNRDFGRTAVGFVHNQSTVVLHLFSLVVGPHELKALGHGRSRAYRRTGATRWNPGAPPERRGGSRAARRADDRQPACRGRPAQIAAGSFLRAVA